MRTCSAAGASSAFNVTTFAQATPECLLRLSTQNYSATTLDRRYPHFLDVQLKSSAASLVVIRSIVSSSSSVNL